MEKKNTGMKVVIVILCLLVVGLTGYIVYDKVLNKDNSHKNVINYNYSITDRKNVQTLQHGYLEILVDLKGDVFLSVIGNVDNIKDSLMKRNLSTLKNNLFSYFPEGYVDYTGQGSEYKSRKLDIFNVLSVYYVSIGNDKTDCFVFIKENGKLSYLFVNHDAGTLPLFDIEELENIVSIVANDYTKTPYAVDIYGNEYLLNEYIK